MHDFAQSHDAPAFPNSGPDHLPDDEVAATQQSILEELHIISEEVLTQHLSHNHLSTDDCIQQQPSLADVNEHPEPLSASFDHAEEPHVSDSEPASPDDDKIPAFPLPEPEGIPTSPTFDAKEASLPTQIPSLAAIAEAAPTDSIATVVAEGALAEPSAPYADATAAIVVQEAGARSQAATEACAKAALTTHPQVGTVANNLESSQPALASPAQQSGGMSLMRAVPVASDLLDPSDIKMEVEAEADLDHTDLFDGIDADAFDDIELSPPICRQAFLPPMDDAARINQSQAPTSPTRINIPTASQHLAGLELSFDGDDVLGPEPPEAPPGSQMSSFLAPSFVGFKTGRGKQVKPSEKALEAARKLMLHLEASQDLLPPPLASQSAFQTASQSAFQTASQSASQFRPRAFESPSRVPQPILNGDAAKSTLDREPMHEIAPPQSSISNADQVQSPLSKSNPASAHVVTAAQVTPASQVQRQPFVTPRPVRSALFSNSQSLASPMRTRAAASGSRFTTPQPSKRISLGMMPRVEIGGSTGRKRTMPKFVTPFKDGKRPRAEEQEDPTSPLRRLNSGDLELSKPNPVVNRQYPPTSASKVQASTSSQGPAVFIMQSAGPRQKLSDVGRPEYYSILQMIAKGVPDEVAVILKDASRAARYAFEAPNGGLLMQKHALDELLARGCSNAKLPWVQNHWTLILWKLAAMVRFEPSSARERWSWNEVIRQLLYRYEREVHLAQRSCIKRIQEHDSSPARPMVLFVSNISEEENEVRDKAGAISTRRSTILELSDGWYRIQAQIDPVLTRACQGGRLRIGQKLAIMGATLDTQGDGIEVLTAYHLSSLVLASNSVSLAPWDAKLGFAPSPFFASLRSLTPDGGVVSLMDVIITRVYPIAYMDVEHSSKSGAQHRGAAEEAEQLEAWTKKREDAMARLELEMESENRKLYDLVEALGDLVGDSFLPSIPDDPSGRLEAMANTLFEQLRVQANPVSAVHEMVVAAGHTSLVPWLHNFAKRALLAEDGLGSSSGLAAALDRLCPPRKVREFRVVSFRDARLPPPPPTSTAAAAIVNASASAGGKKKNPHARTVHLTVYDAAQLGDELQEGRRFWVTNLMPTSKSSWRKPDDDAVVSLSTRRDTKWRAVS
ncbi:related to Brh2 - Rad51-associated protein Brh2 [Ustilago trichophora]|uniref:Related to Brh2 - Rad51-associated protein Brh2 n=1 Tax=Ustilago trichophora TaxID=86804 RepID=A0A5C3E9F1_9BASI|nr:related to Brh2 - Rad51-associated protein Brh2 [Ustilago trichophora]